MRKPDLTEEEQCIDAVIGHITEIVEKEDEKNGEDLLSYKFVFDVPTVTFHVIERIKERLEHNWSWDQVLVETADYKNGRWTLVVYMTDRNPFLMSSLKSSYPGPASSAYLHETIIVI